MTSPHAPAPPDPQARILDGAIRLLAREGVKALSQPRIAKEAGLRQSHLTYYFPKKKDLIEAVLARFLDAMTGHLAEAASRGLKEGLRTLHDLVTAPVHMRMFAGLIVESDRDPELREVMARSVWRSEEALSRLLGRESGDPVVRHLVATLWGMGLRRMLTQEPVTTSDLNLLLRPFKEAARPVRRHP